MRMIIISMYIDPFMKKRKGRMIEGLSRWLSQKESSCNTGETDSISASGISPGGGNGNSLQDSCLENSIDRRALWARVQRVAKSQTWLRHTHENWICTNFWCFGDINDIHISQNVELMKQTMNTWRDLRILRYSQTGHTHPERGVNV